MYFSFTVQSHSKPQSASSVLSSMSNEDAAVTLADLYLGNTLMVSATLSAHSLLNARA